MRWRSEAGFVGGLEALPFGFLVFVAGSLLLLNAWAVVDGHLAASAAAREAARSFVESSGSAEDAREAAEAVAAETIEGYGKAAGRMRVAWAGAALARCQAVSVTVAYDVPTVTVPWIGSFGSGVLTTSARHTEIVDPYRDGLDLGGGCG